MVSPYKPLRIADNSRISSSAARPSLPHGPTCWREFSLAGGAATQGIVDAPVLQRLGPQGFLINVSLFELISRRYQNKSTLVTTNKPFAQWHEVFPNAACVVSLIDRLVHRCEVVAIQGQSYRLKEAQERAEQKAALRTGAGRKRKKNQ